MRKTLILIAFLIAPSFIAASPLTSVLPGAEQRGAATFRYLGFPLYRARLFTKGGAPLDWNANFGLELTYLRNLTRFDLVESTMRELKRTGGALPVRDKLNACFADVAKGDSYLAVTQGPNKIGFWRNGVRSCTLSHPRISARFMGIFLGDKTRSKSFTRRLRGE